MKVGIYMFLIMVLQTSALLFILKSQKMLYTNDYILYGIAYGLAFLVLAYCSIPYIMLPERRKANNFKLSYATIFGIILFLAAIALTYAINTFIGLNNSNLILFSSKLLMPIILSINFIIYPLVYKMVLNNKKLY